jgi:hypothetical protein
MDLAHLGSEIVFNHAFGQFKEEKHVWILLFRGKPEQKVHKSLYHRF